MGRGRKNGSTVPAGETSQQKFVRLGVKRMNNFLMRARQLKNLAYYDHTEPQSKKLLEQCVAAVEDVKQAFERKQSNQGSFSFD